MIIDKNIYDDLCLSKAIYSLAEEYTILRKVIQSNREEWTIINVEHEDDSIRAKIINTLNDYKLRGIIEKETHDIRTILYAKAFMDCEDISEHDLD